MTVADTIILALSEPVEITAGQKGSGKSARSTFVAQPKLSDAEQEAAAKKRKEILAEMGIGRPSE